MPLDISALAPGPGGTTMLGERGGLEAAARRGLERQKREREEAAAREGKVIDDAMSGTTLATEDTQPAESKQHGDIVTNTGSEIKDVDHNTRPRSSQAIGSEKKEGEGKWKRFTKHFR